MICFPFVGGNANNFLPLAKIFWADVEIIGLTPPGQEAIIAVRQKALVNTSLCLKELSGIFKKQVIFLGYSMGAVVAYHLTRKLDLAGNPVPQLLILTASVIPEDYYTKKETTKMDDEAFIKNPIILVKFLSRGYIIERFLQNNREEI
ncbi:MAG: hypothetical protein JXR70_07450 [Spirochaetales bacterium]|nr:hypothetical protein [Spirochaetales bacterium]